MTPPTATTTQLAVLEQLPSPVRLEALEWDAALRTLSPPVGKALARLAAQFGCDAVTARRRYDRWRRHGVLGTVNAARAGVRLRDLLRGSAHVHRQSIAKTATSWPTQRLSPRVISAKRAPPGDGSRRIGKMAGKSPGWIIPCPGMNCRPAADWPIG